MFINSNLVSSRLVNMTFAAMSSMSKIRATNIAVLNMGPQEGITLQICKVRTGRTCAAALEISPAKAANFEAMLVFAHHDETSTNAWKIQLQDEQDLRAARMVDLYDDGPYPYGHF